VSTASRRSGSSSPIAASRAAPRAPPAPRVTIEKCPPGTASNRVDGAPTGYLSRMHGTSEPDVERDSQLARTRETGGVDSADEARPGNDRAADPDGPSTTGTERNEEFVGRVAGQDAGFSGETGAEARAAAGGTSGTAAADTPAADTPAAQQGGGR
jgi:hypothetical protein